LDAKRRSRRLSLAIPSTLVSEIPHLREKTAAIGQIGRAASIFRVDDIYVYQKGEGEAKLIDLILSYMETPQYLRRHLFGKRPELAYVGILPPLRTPHHPVENRSARLMKGGIREGVVLGRRDEDFLVDVGVEKPLMATGRGPSKGGRATVRVTETKPELRGMFVGRKDVESYWGYSVHTSDRSLGKLTVSDEFDLTIATSRLGQPYSRIEGQLRENWERSTSILVAFGSPSSGIRDILAEEQLKTDEVFHFAVNTIPEQGCETVRTEEAVFATLALLNILEPGASPKH